MDCSNDLCHNSDKEVTLQESSSECGGCIIVDNTTCNEEYGLNDSNVESTSETEIPNSDKEWFD